MPSAPCAPRSRCNDTIADCDAAAGVNGLRIRIGINTGEVLVGALRVGGDYTAMGDVVNSAQRLQTTAQPGQIVVGNSTHAATRHVVRYTDLGPVNARGRDEPIYAWVAEEALLPPGARPGRGTAPMVGRDEELGLLTRAVDTAVRRRRAQLLLVVAEAGMGKTRLAEEVASRGRVRPRRGRARGALRPVRRGQRVVAGGRGAALHV